LIVNSVAMLFFRQVKPLVDILAYSQTQPMK